VRYFFTKWYEESSSFDIFGEDGLHLVHEFPQGKLQFFIVLLCNGRFFVEEPDFFYFDREF
jgi:hypothetical protein